MTDTLRNLYYMARCFRTATALNLIGLTVTFTAFYLLMTQVQYNAGYNRGLPDAERLFRVEAKMNLDAPWGVHCNRPVLEMMMQLPEVETGTILPMWGGTKELYQGETPVEYEVSKIHGELSLLPFGPECLDGKLTWNDGSSTGVLIPASLAERFFDTTMAAGQYLWTGQDSVRVMGVYRDFPENCFLQNAIYVPIGEEERHNYSEWSFIGYLRIYASVDADAFRAEFKERVKATFRKIVMAENADEYEKLNAEERAEWDQQIEDYFGRQDFRVTPLTETYFSGVDPSDKGNRTVHLILVWACVVILLVAAINFLNFTLAEAPMRVKGVNTRRVLGEQESTLWLSLIAETVVTALFAFVLSLGVIYLLSQWPAIAELFSGNISLMGHWPQVGWIAAIAVLIGIIAGTYPAFFVTSFQPALVLKGSFGLTPKGRRLRTTLIALQVFISLILVTYIGILYLQSHFIYHSDYGFNKDELLYCQLSNELKGKKDAVRTELLQMGGVEDVSYSNFVLGSQPRYMGWGRGNGDHAITFTCFPVDWRYLRTMRVATSTSTTATATSSTRPRASAGAGWRWTRN